MTNPTTPECPSCKAQIPWFFIAEIMKGSKEFFDVAEDHIIGLITECAFCHQSMVFVLTNPTHFRIATNDQWRAIVGEHQAGWAKERKIDLPPMPQPSKN